MTRYRLPVNVLLLTTAVAQIQFSDENAYNPVPSPDGKKIAAVRTALEGTDVAAVATATQALSESMQKLGAAVYGQAGGQEGGPSTPPKGDAGTVEGEFREV